MSGNHQHKWVLTYEVENSNLKGYHCACGESKLIEGSLA